MEMAVAELLEDFLDEPTCPGTPSGIRLKQMHTEEGLLLRLGQMIRAEVSGRDRFKKHYDRLGKLLANVESWQLGLEPDAEIRQRTVDDFELTIAAIVNLAVGNR